MRDSLERTMLGRNREIYSMVEQGDQKNRHQKIKKQRNNSEVEKSLKMLKKAAEGEDNLMPYIIDAVKTYASVGEISNRLRDVFGEYKEHVVI